MMPVGDFLRLLGIYDDEVEMVVDGQPILLVLHRSNKSDSPMFFEEHAKAADGPVRASKRRSHLTLVDR
jgi:hypothetical protein